MAGTYGTRDATQFLLPSVESNEKYYTIVERDSGKITLKRIVPGSFNESLDATVGTIESSGPNAGKFVPGAGASGTEVQAFAQQPQAVKAVKDKATETVAKAKVKEGKNPQESQTEANKLLSPNAATAPGSADGQTSLTKFQTELESGGGFKKNTRENYQDVKYPLNLKLENQDCIKFSILKYIPPGVKPGASNAQSRIVKLQDGSKPGINGKPIATITLPIPAGINDRNPADWSSSSLDDITRAFSNISMQTILNGGQGLTGSFGRETSNAAPGGDTSFLGTLVAATATEQATGASNILSRQFGAVVNPNMELLFNGPSLRSFTFNFRFTPRETNEAKAVRKIIRQFKQAMSVKRSASSLILRAPHTFAIAYLSNNKDHPYLNRFKECALTDCAVSYTPDGTYMTYTDSSMTAYELSLTFQELEPIFDDEYYDIDKNNDTSIGF
jgi:hypothetical protein